MATREDKRAYAREIDLATVARLAVPANVDHWSRPRWYQRARWQQATGTLRLATNGVRETARRVRQIGKMTPDPVIETAGPNGERLLTFQGVTDSIRGWARRMSISDSTMRRRIEKHGLTGAFQVKKEVRSDV